MLHYLQLALAMVFPVLVIVAALRDCTTYTIPNWISLILIAVFPLAALAAGLTLPSIGMALLLGVAGLLVGMGMFAAGWVGGGDAKLLAASAPWLGLAGVAPFLLVTAMAGGGLAVSLLCLRSGWFALLLANSPSWLARLGARGENVPYGVAIAIGALVAFPESDIAKVVLAGF